VEGGCLHVPRNKPITRRHRSGGGRKGLHCMVGVACANFSTGSKSFRAKMFCRARHNYWFSNWDTYGSSMCSFPIENSPRLKFVKTYLWKRGSQSALFSCHPCSPYSLIKRFSFMNPFHFITRIESNESVIQCYYHACHANQKESWKWYQVQRTQNRTPCSQIWKNAVDGATDRMSFVFPVH
jgi:hypothetical protein